MSTYLNFNGELIPDTDFSIPHHNRAFRYGDGFFETIRCIRGKPLWMPQHFERITKSARILKFRLPEDIDVEYFTQNISRLLKANGHNSGARVRLSIFRDAGGFYRPDGDQSAFLIESLPLENEKYQLNKQGLVAGVFDEISKPVSLLGNIKSSNALVYILASVFAHEQGWNDAIILNSDGCIAEATSSNIFAVKENRVHTPDLAQGCVEGVMRSVVLSVLSREGYKIHECSLLPDDLFDFDEVFLSNTISGVQWVKGFKHKRYYHKISSRVIELINAAADF
ncbi:MAG: aminotransferase class IV [Bacteroidales bacterium]|nr:aminotransferase class IV [Bacteroidales bacterium]